MAATEPLCHLFGINPVGIPLHESLILEVELFTYICGELKEVYRARNKDYFSLMKVSINQENAMLEAKFLSFIINDILMSDEYSLAGISCYTQIPEEVICDVASGKNTTPSLLVSQKMIDLHRKVRPDLYREVVKKITTKYLASI